MRLFSITVLLFFCFISASAQYTILWQQCYGTTEAERALTIIPYEEGYLLGGCTEGTDWFRTCDSINFPYPKPGWISGIDSIGVFENDYCFENLQVINIDNEANSDNLYFLGGGRMLEYPDVINVSVMKSDKSMNSIWARTVGCPGGARYHMGGISTHDGGCLTFSEITSGGGDVSIYYGGGHNIWLAKFSESGDLSWDYSIGNSNGWVGAYELIQTVDSGYIVGIYGGCNGLVGIGNLTCFIEQDGGSDMILFKLDKNGNPMWQKCYGGSHDDYLRKIVELEDGFLIVGGTESSDGDMLNSGNHWGMDVWIAKIDFDGNIIWQKCYGGTEYDAPSDIKETNDGGFIVFARTESDDCDVQGNINDAGHSIWIFKIDANGELLWQKSIQSLGREEVHDVYQKSDTRYVLAGEMWYSPSYDVNCSNYIPFSWGNYYALEIEITDGGVGQDELFSADDIQLYPNPATNSFTIEMPINTSVPSMQMELFNMNGTLLLSSNIQHQKQTFNIQSFPEGCYVVCLRDDENVVYRKLVVR